MHTANQPAFVRVFHDPMARRLLRVAGWLAVTLYFCFALLVLALRYAILPQIENYRGDIEAVLSRSLKQPVSIGAIDAGWSGLRPRLAIRELAIRDGEGRAVLGFDNVLAELAWSSLWRLGLHLHRLEIAAPQLDIRRDANGRYFVAGLEVTPSGTDAGFADWLLAQDRIVVRDAELNWRDEMRGAPPLVLRRLNFDLRNSGSRHRFGFTAAPPRELATRLDVRGELHGDDASVLAAWTGDLYAELDYADLAVWRTWVDYPLELPRGSGGLRLWFSFAGGQPTGVTADLRLADVAVRMAPHLPMLELAHLEGRLAAKRVSDGYEAVARHAALATKDGIRIAPTDLRLRLSDETADRPASGEFDADGLDLGALAALAAHLPLDDSVRARLATYAPRGRLSGLKLSWTGKPDDLKSWRVAGRFAELGLAASGTLPGFAGLSGNIDGDEKGGRLTLDSRQAAIELPTVFADPRLGLAALSAQVKWKSSEAGIEVELAQATFKNHDAVGEASGRYRRGHDGGPGDIDLTARLTQAAGNAVWRYMPLVVNRDVRDWLRGAIEGGIADEATLRLKGDLRKFPFKDGKDGIFEVKGRFRGATLRYASGWPEIRNLEGSLLFEGARMLIQGHRGSIAGVGIGPVSAEIADLESFEELLTVEGRASGATAGFLGFIESSPVGERIDHFTEDMSADGAGELQLRLAMPLRRIAETKVDGRFRFIGNRLAPDPDMPPLTDVNGDLRFTADRLEAQRIRGAMFGMPLVVDVATAGDGGVRVKAAGALAVPALRKHLGHPLLDGLSGTSSWSGTIRVKKKSVDLRIESNLQGIASSLPEPFNKTTNAALPLVVERKQGAAGRDTLNVSLGDAVKATLMRRRESGRTIVERGVVAIGAAPKLPERGVLLAVQAKRIDFDAWRRLKGDGGGDGVPITQLDLRADEVAAYGRDVTNLRVAAAQSGGVWKADVRSAEAVGNLEWDGRGAGRISGHLARLTLSDHSADDGAAAEIPDEMPAVDLTIDRLAVAGKEFGALRLKAANEADGFWNAKFDVRNDDATLEGSGRWRPRTNPPETRLEFKLGTRSIEKLLSRLGYPGAVRRGTAHLEGALAWNGGPLAPDYPSLSGRVRFEAAGGQFNKLEPGVGRLLGVLSLQSLPRRLTLDFRDVFSEGFAFDAIAGEAGVAQGVMTTNNLQIAGPAAKILMTGNVNLVRETQNLKVRIQPAIGETLATGVLLTHPVAGAAAWVFNKLLGNPFDQAFAYEYAVTGSWDDPKVEKLAGPQEAAREERR
jgi:uncharacterized protein (TIGR02099 family)